ncbi:hypothetical protein MA16_Dca017877 [Dendrobium catenatum]|uniref:Endoplasmic reticulum membrane protein C16E8.02 n=1 Tax=Dendrobium catenatum TaxID=906689 RepID=A0A2I0W9Q7_9ASPA|nr:hypothetical protein MA16_Dca017877 [Dendrobium catenatum]
MGKGLLDLEKHFAFYGAYHSNSVNVLIHVFFVWPIFFSSLILFDLTPPILHVPLLGGFDLNFSFFFALFYAVFYISLDRYAGSFAALLCLLCWFGSKSLAAQLGFSLAWKLLQSLFGYEPYPGFHANVLKKIEVDREEWQARKHK